LFKRNLKYKLVAGAFGLVLIFSLAITVVVSIIVNRQNRAAVNFNLESAMSIVRDDLHERKQKMAKELRQMVVDNQIGPTVKFLSEFADGELTITNSTYSKVAVAASNQANISDLISLAIYGMDGKLQNFVVKDHENTRRFGFHHKGNLHYSSVRQGEDTSDDEWHQTRDFTEVGISASFSGELPSNEVAEFQSADNFLLLKVQVPLFTIDYDDNDSEISIQTGALEAHKRIDASVVDRLARLTGMSVNLFADNRFSIGSTPAYETLDTKEFSNTPMGQAGIDSQKAVQGEITLQENTYFQATLPIFNARGYAGAAVVLQSDEIVKANTRQMVLILSLVALACVVLCAPVVILATGAIVKQISGIVARLKDIAEGDGDLTRRLEIKSSDEIGQLAKWFNAFIDNIHNMIREIKANSEKLNNSAIGLSEIAGSMAADSTQTSEKATVVASSGEQLSTNMGLAAASMEEAAGNVQMVAASAEEMNSTVNEISRNTVSARSITAQAVDQAKSATQQVSELGGAAREIGKVLDAITEISEQVNLLALNATIEAARAGEAGKGFAVVANEIKELARQTADATSKIKSQVEGIQNSTHGTVTEIEGITTVVNSVNEIVIGIAGAVEEQSAATASITENVNHAAEGIGGVNQNVSQSSAVAAEIAEDMADVTQAAGTLSRNSDQVELSATELSELADQLKQMVNQFKV
jgi:methyl-accepting chemotaxis protein